ncbi:MAG: hypothetical protein NTW72_11435 [Gemmatimonadetes bacterium]|nr:hypothetical protein [Gemmatimonadota bacterium]
MAAIDPTTFPLREGVTVPRDLVAAHTATLVRCHGESLNVIAARGGISVFELLLLQPPPSGTDAATHRRDVCDLSVTGALKALTGVVDAFYKKREADAEAAMLAMMEEGSEEPSEEPSTEAST